MRESVPSNRRVLSFLADEDLVSLLAERGMGISSRDVARVALQHIGYARLKAYWLPFEQDRSSHKFWPNTTFSRIIEIYDFDRRLRVLMMEAIECIEVSLRAQLGREFAKSYGADGYQDPNIAYNRDKWESAIEMLRTALVRAGDNVGESSRCDKSVALPPIWTAVESLSLGSMVYWYRHIIPRDVQYSIGAVYGIHPDILSTWLRHLNIVRNIVAHHGRLWNRAIPFQPKIPNVPALKQSFNRESTKPYNTLVMLHFLMSAVHSESEWIQEVMRLIELYQIRHSAMGFPIDWEHLPVWQSIESPA